MSAVHESHTITVTRLPGEEDDDLEYSTTCPPTGKSCNVWWECGTCEKAKRPVTQDEEDDGEYTAHGVYHQQIDGYWMTESSQCGLTTDSAQEECWDVAQLVGLGTHDVELDYYGDGQWNVHPAGDYWAKKGDPICGETKGPRTCKRSPAHTRQHHDPTTFGGTTWEATK